MKNSMIIATFIPLLVACGAPLDSSDPRGPRGGKADSNVDTTLTCQGTCGALAQGPSGYCGCDDACASYGDCCDDKATVCDGAPAAIVITKADDGALRTIDVGDHLDVQLASNPSTGYSWHLLTNSRSFPLQKEEYVADSPQLVGSGGTQHFHFTADGFSAGHTFELRFAYDRSWQGAAAAAETFSIKIVVLPASQTCQALDAAYQSKVSQAGACSADADCQRFVGGSLTCGHPTRAINPAHAAQVEALQQSWTDTGCQQLDWNCPMFSPLPPWFETRGVCEQGSCKVQYIDTRAAKEGDGCGDDIGVQCGDGLYCAFGLNWCGTPPVVGVCRKMGDCGAPSDCTDDTNDWIHPACMGEATCTADKCGWTCGAAPF